MVVSPGSASRGRCSSSPLVRRFGASSDVPSRLSVGDLVRFRGFLLRPPPASVFLFGPLFCLGPASFLVVCVGFFGFVLRRRPHLVFQLQSFFKTKQRHHPNSEINSHTEGGFRQRFPRRRWYRRFLTVGSLAKWDPVVWNCFARNQRNCFGGTGATEELKAKGCCLALVSVIHSRSIARDPHRSGISAVTVDLCRETLASDSDHLQSSGREGEIHARLLVLAIEEENFGKEEGSEFFSAEDGVRSEGFGFLRVII
ncbi:hypothetical protein U1Q18_039015 [Sarracenia purpurea var. burkii]